MDDLRSPDDWLALPRYAHVEVVTRLGWTGLADWRAPITERAFQQRLRASHWRSRTGADHALPPLPPGDPPTDPAVTPSARTGDPLTSHLAAASMRGAAAQSQQRAIVAYLLTLADRRASMEEVHDGLGWPRQIATPRFKELARLGRIVDTGTKRINRSGRSAIVWQVIEGVPDGDEEDDP